MHIIYCAVCIADGPDRIHKKYIGQSRSDLAEVIERHLEGARTYGNCRRFYAAIREYGANQFCWGVIDTAADQEDANKKERYYIVRHKTNLPGYGLNILDGGENEELRGVQGTLNHRV